MSFMEFYSDFSYIDTLKPGFLMFLMDFMVKTLRFDEFYGYFSYKYPKSRVL